MSALSYCRVNDTDLFWTPRLATNARHAIFHQWEQLEASGCIENFRLVTGKEGFREGWFFADSDAYKWLDAAARIYGNWPGLEDDEERTRLKSLMDEFITLLGRAQMDDGYIYTYNQLHFPGERWENTMIEHELYCHGHLIEACVSYDEIIYDDNPALKIACKAADRIFGDFLRGAPSMTSGHEEIEIALLRLYEATGDATYLDLTTTLLERRGQVRPFAPVILRQNGRVAVRGRIVAQKRAQYLAAHPDFKPYQVPPGNYSKKPFRVNLRWQWNALTGKYFQMHKPIREQTVPVGHAVRFAYLETAVARLANLTGDRSLLPALEKTWEHMVARRMYVTGGIGSLPALEGFGRDYELDPEIAYAETCAALGSMFWNWEMGKATGEAKYSDLLEWQLYNAAAVGMGVGGDAYFYNNPLLCRGGVERRPWFAVPCCPSNLSRTWASLGDFVYSEKPGELTVHQYIGSTLFNRIVPLANDEVATVSVEMQSGLPWYGKVRLKITAFNLTSEDRPSFALKLRIPSWAEETFITYKSVRDIACLGRTEPGPSVPVAASGVQPHESCFSSNEYADTWGPDDEVELEFNMPITLRCASSRVRGQRGKVAVTRGPLVYCLESVDNPGVDIFTARLDPNSLEHEYRNDLLGGAMLIKGKTTKGQPLTFLPYCLWGNRGPSQMTVWVNVGRK